MDNSPVKHFLIKFDVTGVNGQSVTNAKLCLYNTDGASAGGDFHHVSDDSWQEETVTWNNAPAADTTLLASLGTVSPNTWYEVDMTSHITADGTYSLRISDSVGGADYSSKEGTNDPKLLVAIAGATPQSCSGTATATPTPGATNTPTNTPTPGPSPTPTNTSTPTLVPSPTPTAPAAFNNATFVYDGDGKRVKSTFNGTTTTYFVGAHYEVTGSTITKYYYAGAQRIAMRTNGTLNYLLGDHLGSTSLVTDSTGVKINEQRYKAWGETRYTFGNEKTKYQYTGQFSYEPDFGLMYYGARWYDSSLGRFNQPDMLIPPTQGVQAWDRYAYTNNNPVKYTDPSGHFIETAWDFAMIGVDLIDIAQNGLNWSNGAALAVDVASAIIPGIPAVGGVLLKTAKAANAVGNIVDTANAVDTAVDVGNAADNLADLGNVIGDVCSFSADTQVTTREGSEDISAIEIGDSVLAWNEADGILDYYEVTATFSHADEILTELIINGEWIETTPEHPFYTKEEGWLPADELKPGMHIRQADGDYELVWLKWNVYKTQEMYNLTVDTAHTFFVGEGQWLVHNDCRTVNMDAVDWSDYPSDIVPKPEGQLQFLDGTDYDDALKLKKTTNANLQNQYPEIYGDYHIHEIQPVKFGGSPTDMANKIPLAPGPHMSIVTPWWNRLQRRIERNPELFLMD